MQMRKYAVHVDADENLCHMYLPKIAIFGSKMGNKLAWLCFQLVLSAQNSIIVHTFCFYPF